MFKVLMALVVWVAGPRGDKPNQHLGCQILLTSVKSAGREGRLVFFGGLNVSSKLLRLLRQNRRADYLTELARSKDVEFQFEPLLKFRNAFYGVIPDQREINLAEIKRLFPKWYVLNPFGRTVLTRADEGKLTRWLDSAEKGWRSESALVVHAPEAMRLFGRGSNERVEYSAGSVISIVDGLAVRELRSPPPVAEVVDVEDAAFADEGEGPLTIETSVVRRAWSRLRGRF